jgi:DNA-binding transcriptional LysR family regulator
MDRVSCMVSFVKVVENSGFSAAARQLDISTSIVTTHVKSLEDRLGVRLLNRSTRNVSLTEAGQAYYESCVQILSEIEDADEAAQALQLRPRGNLRLNVAPAIPAIIAPSIAEFTALYSDVSVRLTVTSRMVDLVEEGFDLAIRNTPVPDSSLIVRRLAAYRFVVCASPAYLAKRGQPRHPADLAEHSCLIFQPWGKAWLFAGPDGDLPVRISGSLEANSGDALRLAALLGQGLIYVPIFVVADDLKARHLIPVLRDFLTAERSIDALYPHRRHLSAKVRSFIDLVIKNFHDTTWDAAGERHQVKTTE